MYYYMKFLSAFLIFLIFSTANTNAAEEKSLEEQYKELCVVTLSIIEHFGFNIGKWEDPFYALEDPYRSSLNCTETDKGYSIEIKIDPYTRYFLTDKYAGILVRKGYCIQMDGSFKKDVERAEC